MADRARKVKSCSKELLVGSLFITAGMVTYVSTLPVAGLFPFVAEFQALVKASSRKNQLEEPVNINHKGSRTKEKDGLGRLWGFAHPITKKTSGNA